MLFARLVVQQRAPLNRLLDAFNVDAPLAAGDMVVTEGVQSVREGSDVRVAAREPAAGGS